MRLVPVLGACCLATEVEISEEGRIYEASAEGSALMQRGHKQVLEKAYASEAEELVPETSASKHSLTQLAAAKPPPEWYVKWQKDGKVHPGEVLEVQKRHVGSCFTTAYGALLGSLIIVVIVLLALVTVRGKALKEKDRRIRAMHTKIRADKHTQKKDEKELSKMVDELQEERKKDYLSIISVDRVEFDFVGKRIHLKEDIAFLPDTSFFANPGSAHAIIMDVAKLLGIFDRAVLLIEGHTQVELFLSQTELSQDSQIDDLARDLAWSRAEAVKRSLIGLGIDELRLDAIGLPGGLGKNEERVEMRIVGI